MNKREGRKRGREGEERRETKPNGKERSKGHKIRFYKSE